MANSTQNQQSPSPSNSGGGSGSAILTAVQNIVTAINGLASTLSATRVQIKGSFNLAAASTTVVAQTLISSTSTISFSPVNASAATLMGSTKALYLQSQTAGVGFTVATADGTSAAGTEVFSYTVFNG